MTDEAERERKKLWETFDPNNPSVQILLLSKRLDNIGQEKEEIEKSERALEKRVAHLEFLLSKDRIAKIDEASQFMSNAEFMGKWTWRAIYGFIILSGGFFAAFKFWKGQQ